MNIVVLVGNIGKQPEPMKYTQAGTAVFEFSLATHERRGDSNETHWHQCKAFGKLAESIAPMIVSGAEVFVQGKIWSRDYVGRDGVKKRSVEVVVNFARVSKERDRAIAHDDIGEFGFGEEMGA